MVSVLSLLIPIALSAVFVFIASSIIHMATPWHKDDLMKLPERRRRDERAAPVQPAAGQLRLPEARLDGGHEVAGVPWRSSRPVRSAFMTVSPAANLNMGGTLVPVVPLFAGRLAVCRLHRRRRVRPGHRIPAHHAGGRLRRVLGLLRWRRCTSRSGGAAAGAGPSATCSTACSTAC